MTHAPFWSVNMPMAWPAPPEIYSFSSLAEIEACPRKWALRHAKYPHWEGQPYPDRPSVAAMKGTVVHRALELICKRVAGDGATPGLGDPALALREFGGFTILIQQALEDVLRREAGPRTEQVAASLRKSLGAAVAELRRELQAMVGRLDVLPTNSVPDRANRSEPATSGSVAYGRRPLDHGTHTEVTLLAPSLRLKGVVDLLSVNDEGAEVVDFKTGRPQAHHVDQLRMYGLLWAADSVSNPSGLPVRTLRLSYVGEDVTIPPPPRVQAATDASRQQARAAEADALLLNVPPKAIPTEANCTFCSVKHLCSDFWSQEALQDDPRLVRFVDATVRVQEQLGERTWAITPHRLVPGPFIPVEILRNVPPGAAYQAGEELTVLGGVLRSDDLEPAIGVTATTEIFRGVCLTS